MAAQLDEAGLRQLVEYLKNSLSGHDRNKQKEAELMLIKARDNPHYLDYLTYIFRTPQIGEQLNISNTNTPGPAGTVFLVRYAAAIQLKNHIKNSYKSIPNDKLSQVKAATLAMLQDQNAQLRSFSGTIITEIVQQGGLLRWPEVLSELMNLVSNSSGTIPPETQIGSMSALTKVCEDNRKMLDKEYNGQRPIAAIIPKMLEFAGHREAPVRSFALQSLKNFISVKSEVFMQSLNDYLSKVFERANDPDEGVRRIVCQSLVALVESKPESLAPNMDGLVNYILTQQQNVENPLLAMDAAEFWLSVAEQEQLRGLMEPYLEKVIPTLLSGMVYGEEDQARLEKDQTDADEEDRPEDIKPQFAQTKAGRGAISEKKEGEDTKAQVNGTKEKPDLSDGEIEESGEDSESDWDDEDPEDAWSLRKCSAAALDVFAVNYHDKVFNIILPYLKDNLSHPLWPKREAAVLALGAIAEGCMDVVSPHLPELVPFLISLLGDEEPVVRQITCWCLARYSEWAAQLTDPADKQKYWVPTMEGLLHRMLDKNKKVQEAGASSFASLEEKAGGDALRPYIQPILQQFIRCFQQYKEKNMYILYDCLQTLSESVGADLAQPHLIALLMPTLTHRWNTISDDSREMFPLLGCLGYIALSYGPSFSPYAPTIFSRCISLIYSNLQQHMAYMSGASADSPDRDFIVSALDLLSAIIQALPQQSSTELVRTSQPSFIDLLSFCMEDPTPDVRQSAYALLGDCAVSLYPTIAPSLPDKILPILIRQMDLDNLPASALDGVIDTSFSPHFNVLINVCWSLGELGLRSKPDQLLPFMDQIYSHLLTIVTNEEVPSTCSENASMTLGRLGLSIPDYLAPRLSEFAPPFLACMSHILTTTEKAEAYLGLNNVIQRNPTAMEGCLIEYILGVAGFPLKAQGDNGVYVRTRETFGQTLNGFKNLIGEQAWETRVLGGDGRVTAAVRQKLRDGYGI